MSKQKRNIIISTTLITLSILFTLLVKVVDVQQIGVEGTSIGFATINQFVFKTLRENELWYNITEILGLVALATVAIYGLIGLTQVIKRKSLLKVDKEIIALGIFYVVVIGIYILFEKVIVNYRPVLIDGIKEASYPSSHTLMTTCLCISAVIINKKLFNNKITKYTNLLLLVIMSTTVIGRLLSGVHWFTDIIGGILISTALLTTFYTIISKSNK